MTISGYAATYVESAAHSQAPVLAYLVKKISFQAQCEIGVIGAVGFTSC